MNVDTKGVKKLFDPSALLIGDTPISVFRGTISYRDCERGLMIADVNHFYFNHIRAVRPNGNPTGLIRFDGVPKLAQPSKRWGNIGGMSIGGYYEANFGSPECVGASAAMLAEYPNAPCVNAPALVAEQIKKTFGDVEIAFVVGHGSVLKHHWWRYLVDALRAAGLKIKVMEPEEVMKKEPPYVWRWGDVRRIGENDYANCPAFTEWLYTQSTSVVFNTVLKPEDDIADKSILVSSEDPCVSKVLGENFVLDSEDVIIRSLERNRFVNQVAKPDGGSSGKDIFFGKHYRTDKRGWENVLRGILSDSQKKYCLWEANWLPVIEINGQRFVFDLNPTFWVHDDKLTYLYTIIRILPEVVYNKVCKINVSTGGWLAWIIR